MIVDEIRMFLLPQMELPQKRRCEKTAHDNLNMCQNKPMDTPKVEQLKGRRNNQNKTWTEVK